MSQFDTTESATIETGLAMHKMIADLFDIHRSMCGPGLRATLARLKHWIPLDVLEVASGTRVFDWVVPDEWHLHDAYIRDGHGNKVVDLAESNLHVLSHSLPVQKRMRWTALEKHLTTLPSHPEWIPYRTTHFRDDWGFCLRHDRFLELEQRGDVEYDVVIDAEFSSGSLAYGELLLPGQSEDEVLLSAHTCHPSLANDNLSGIAVATFLARALAGRQLRYSYRFVFAPATIGAITWLARNETRAQQIKHGLILSVIGDAGDSTYKRSRRGNAEIDRAATHVLQHSGTNFTIRDFEPLGYDERQYCSPGFNLPVGCLMRTPNGCYEAYHTSADDLDFVRPESLADSLSKCLAIVDVLEHNKRYVNRLPRCEPQLGRRGLYETYGRAPDGAELQRAVQWVLNLSDGRRALLDIADRSQLPFAIVHQAAELLLEHQLLEPSPSDFPSSMSLVHKNSSPC